MNFYVARKSEPRVMEIVLQLSAQAIILYQLFTPLLLQILAAE